MDNRRITWSEAEALHPGISADWTEMNKDESLGYRLGPHLMPTPNVEDSLVEVWLMKHVESDQDDFIELRSTLVKFPCDDREIEWYYPPSWRRWSNGVWTSPIPHTMALRRGLVDAPPIAKI